MQPTALGTWLKDALFSDLGNKGTAFLLALLVWWFAFNHTEDSQVIIVDVLIQSDNPAALAVVRKSVSASSDPRARATPFGEKVQLRIKGQKSTLMEVLEDPGNFNGSFTVRESGELDLTQSENYRLPRGVEIVTAEPSRVSVQVEPVITESKPVRLATRGSPKPPYKYNPNRSTLQPAMVAVTGPSSEVKAIVEVETDRLNIESKEGPRLEEKVTLRKPGGEMIAFAPDTPATIKVTLDLEERVENLELTVEILFSVPDDYRMRVTGFERPKLILSGTREVLEEAERRAKDGRLYAVVRVPVDELGTDKLMIFQFGDLILPDGALPEGVKLIGSEPANLSYRAFVERVQ